MEDPIKDVKAIKKRSSIQRKSSSKEDKTANPSLSVKDQSNKSISDQEKES